MKNSKNFNTSDEILRNLFKFYKIIMFIFSIFSYEPFLAKTAKNTHFLFFSCRTLRDLSKKKLHNLGTILHINVFAIWLITMLLSYYGYEPLCYSREVDYLMVYEGYKQQYFKKKILKNYKK